MGNERKSFQDMTYQAQLGQHATVQRTQEHSDAASRSYAELRHAGERMKPSPALKYMGSVAAHVYYAEGMQQIFVVSMPRALDDCPSNLANTALRDLEGSVKEYYGMRRPKLRSGF